MSITIKDIAEIANVSIATVSRYFNNPEKLKKEKRERIEEVVNQYNYQPNALARGLITKATKTVGIIIPDINNLFYPAVIRGIEDTFEKNNYNIILCNTDKDINKEIKYINVLLEKRVDGIILMGTRPSDLAKNEHINMLSNKIPVVIINDSIPGTNVYSVLTDEIEGAYKAVHYLLELGHRKIAYISGEGGYTTYQNKQRGYELALMKYGLSPDKAYIVSDKPYPDGGYRAMKKLLGLENCPTAIFTASDQIAMGVIKAVFEEGCRIPDDFSLVGFANIPVSADIYPELTTVDQFPYETGRLAVETLIKIMNGEELLQKKIILEPKLLIRKSCKELK